jgi:hypothetical protein
MNMNIGSSNGNDLVQYLVPCDVYVYVCKIKKQEL